MDNPATTFRFMDLPAELRLRVYHYLLGRRYPIVLIKYQNDKDTESKLCASSLYSNRRRRTIRLQLNNIGIVMANRQVYREAAPILYNKEFAFNDYAALNHFVEVINDMSSHVKHLRFIPKLDNNQQFKRLEYTRLRLGSLTNPSTLTVCPDARIWQESTVALNELAASIAPIVRPIYEARKNRGDHPDQAADMLRIGRRFCPLCTPSDLHSGPQSLGLGECDLNDVGTTCYAMYHRCEELTVEIQPILKAALMDGGSSSD